MVKYTAAENRKAFQRWLAVKDDGIVGPATLAAFDTRMVNLCAVAVTGDDIKRFASDLSVSTQHDRAVSALYCWPDRDRLVIVVEATTPVLREVGRRSGACVSGGDGCGMNGAIRSDAVRVA